MRRHREARLAMKINVALGTPSHAVPLEVERLGAKLGAQIRGLDLKQAMPPEIFSALEAALIEHKVLVLPDQHLTSAEHVAVSRMFGDLEVHPMRPQGDYPEIIVLENPTKYTILRCQIMPKTGGDTLWADMEAAYEGLSGTFKKTLEGLRAIHDFQNFRVLFKNTDEDRARLRRMEELFPNPSHPVVRTHPVTGRKSIYVNPQFTLRIEGLAPAESRAILDVLFARAQVPEYQFRLRWTPGMIVFWDNRSTQHYAANDYYPERRRMERTAVVGDVPY
jgi:taurine dioxygenase